MKEFTSTLYTNDNLFVLCGLNSNLVDLIYLDPPFNSKRFYSAPIGSKAAGSSFKDMWSWQDVNEAYLDTLAEKFPSLTKFITETGRIHSKAMMAYLTYMVQRIIEMHRILKDTGSLYLHCDPTASHYLKILLDEIFGKDNFRNEIVWHYRRWTGKAKKFQALHDIIFWYSKSDNYTFNPLFTEYTEESKKRKMGGVLRRFKKGEEPYLVSNKELDQQGVRENDVWQIPFINPSAKERTGYPTQKPLALLHRIIKASSNEGDIVLDPFCGCATTCVAAQQLDRKWVGIDIEKQAVNILIERLSNDAGMFKDFVNTTLVPQRTDIEIEEPSKSIKERLYKKQNCLCNACGTKFDVWNLEIDHIIPKAKGGGDYYENYQLLCGSCNKIKGDRPMEYLRLKIKTREEMLGNKIVFGE
jgi:site-specific DNA-methyltransferase (adenine-specific)